MRRSLIALFSWLWLSAGAMANVPCTLPFNLQNATTADATQVMANYNALVTCLGNAAAAGANADITALLGLTTPVPYTAGGSSVYIGGTSTGSANAQLINNPTPLGFSLAQGKSILFIAGFTNVTGSNTQFNVNGTGLVNVAHPVPGGTGSELLAGGEITAGSLVQAFYDGTQYVVLSVTNQLGGAGPVTTIASAATTNIANAVNHNASVTGTTSITSFGATASLNVPIYRVTFTGILTITYNQTNCSTVGGCILTPGGANITTAANDTATLQYLGNGSGGGGNWQVISYSRANGTAVVNPTPLCGATGFTFFNNAGTPNTNFDYAATAAVLINPTGNVPIYGTNIAGTINTTNGLVTSAADGMDGEARPTSVWGYAYLISDGTNFKGLMSTSATAPTMPTSYTYRCLLAAMPFDGSQNAYRVRQLGSVARYTLTAATNTTSSVSIISGVSGNPSTASLSWTATVVTGNTKCAPSIATNVHVLGWTTGGLATLATIFAPNSSYTGYDDTTILKPRPYVVPFTNVSASTVWSTLPADILLETNSIYYASSEASAGLFCLGYKLPVNAN